MKEIGRGRKQLYTHERSHLCMTMVRLGPYCTRHVDVSIVSGRRQEPIVVSIIGTMQIEMTLPSGSTSADSDGIPPNTVSFAIMFTVVCKSELAGLFLERQGY